MYGAGPFDNMSNHFCLCLSAVAVGIIALITLHRYMIQQGYKETSMINILTYTEST